MDIALWALQVILAIKFLSSAVIHGLQQNRGKMQQGIEKMGAAARPLLAVAAAAMLVGSIGLILPAVTHVLAWLVPLTAAVLALMMLSSIPLHLKCREDAKVFVSLILFALAAFTAYGRWVIAPL